MEGGGDRGEQPEEQWGGGQGRGNMNLTVSWTEQSLAVFQQTRAKVERIDQMLPKRLHYLVERGEKVIRLVEMVEGGARWVEKAREKRTSNTTAQEQLKMKLAVSDKENVMNQMLNEFLLLEREVTGSGMDVKTQLAKEVRGSRTTGSPYLEMLGEFLTVLMETSRPQPPSSPAWAGGSSWQCPAPQTGASPATATAV